MLASHVLAPPTQPPADRIEFEQYLLENGLIYQAGSGLYCYSPIFKMMIRNIERLIENCFESHLGAVPVELPTLQNAEFFEKSGRMDLFGEEVFSVVDRKGRRYILSPTNEEVIATIYDRLFSQNNNTRMSLYQIDKKFRDELGGGSISRTREFRMAELYTIHPTENDVCKMSASVVEAFGGLLSTLHCDFQVIQSKETITSQYSGFLSTEFRVKSKVNTGIRDDSGNNLLELAKWTPLGNTYFSNKSKIMSCLGVGAVRILLHKFEQLCKGQEYNKGMSVQWPSEIQQYRTAILLPDRNSRYFDKRDMLSDLAKKFNGNDTIVDDRSIPKFAPRFAQLFSLGIERIFTLSGDNEHPFRIHYIDGSYNDSAMDKIFSTTKMNSVASF